MKNLWRRVVESSKNGGLAYFLVACFVVSSGVLVQIAVFKANEPFFESIAWLVSAAISVLICFPFLLWFSSYTENKWGWKYVQIISWKDVLAVACWTVAGVVFSSVLWYLGYVIL